MSRIRTLVLGTTAGLAGLAAVGFVQGALATDPSQLPEFKGTVERYSLAPRGEVDGLILSDGTEVHLPPHLAGELTEAVKPGAAVTVRGLKTLRLPLVDAATVTDDASGRTVVDTGPSRWPRLPSLDRRDEIAAQGTVRMALHGPRGEANGVLLDDGTFLRLPPHEAVRLADMLAPGQALAARGPGVTGPNGTVIEVELLGPSPDQLAKLAPPPGPKGPPPPPRG